MGPLQHIRGIFWDCHSSEGMNGFNSKRTVSTGQGRPTHDGWRISARHRRKVVVQHERVNTIYYYPFYSALRGSVHSVRASTYVRPQIYTRNDQSDIAPHKISRCTPKTQEGPIPHRLKQKLISFSRECVNSPLVAGRGVVADLDISDIVAPEAVPPPGVGEDMYFPDPSADSFDYAQ
ncbi:hypothetical protein CPB84DRAFT_1844303 [Gymnopilus junonius]|uniref:Uncharacterized protein n=1 Tax=Gymnopilus junonius TaxID=109634 RepID=A0A9P5NU82_GYMJU|nr:hypothetical protein CPB84DRAFT_1844303 [Gymnopilus junonius]